MMTRKKVPLYKSLEIEPKQGGQKQVLSKNFLTQKKKEQIPLAKDISDKPIVIKATPKNDDGFIPPPNNFVAVGQVQQAWATKEVTGLPDEMQDNNWSENASEEEKDLVEQKIKDLQGIDPLSLNMDKSTNVQLFKNQLEKVYNEIANQLSNIEVNEFNTIKNKILSQDGVLGQILNNFKNNLTPQERNIVGEFVSNFIDRLKLLLSSKEEEFDSEDIYDENDSEDNSYDVQRLTFSLEEGEYVIFVDNEFLVKMPDSVAVRNSLQRLILGDNIDIERIKVLKRIPIDFGVVLDG